MIQGFGKEATFGSHLVGLLKYRLPTLFAPGYLMSWLGACIRIYEMTKREWQWNWYWGGTARDLVRELPIDSETNGVVFDPGDGQGPRQYNGLNFIVTVLTLHFSHLDEEESARQLMGLWSFRRRPTETMGSYLAWFSILHHRSATINQIALSPGQQCFTLMHGMGMSNRDMWDCLRTLNGRMPQDQAELQHVLIDLRRYGDIVE